MASINTKGRSALIVEDNEELSEMYKDALLLENIEDVTVAADINSAEQLIIAQKYEVWILDWNIKNKTVSSLLNRNIDQEKMPKLILIITADLESEEEIHHCFI